MDYFAHRVAWLKGSGIREFQNAALRTRRALEALHQLPAAILGNGNSAWSQQCRSCAATIVAITPAPRRLTPASWTLRRRK